MTEAGEGPRQIERQFGHPAQLAADLRAAAGYPPPPAGQTAVPASTAQWLREQSRHPAAAAVIRYLASLRPAWWAARGYLLVAGVLAAVTRAGGYRLHTLGSYKQAFDDNTQPRTSSLWLLIPVAAVLASIVLGHLTPRLPRATQLLIVGLNAAAVLTLLAYPPGRWGPPSPTSPAWSTRPWPRSPRCWRSRCRGQLAVPLAERYDRVVGADPSPDMIAGNVYSALSPAQLPEDRPAFGAGPPRRSRPRPVRRGRPVLVVAR